MKFTLYKYPNEGDLTHTYSPLMNLVDKDCKIGGWRYAVYQNIAGDLSDKGQPNGTIEAARNPAQAGKVLSACYSGLSTNTSDELNLSQTYKIKKIDFSEFAEGGKIQGIIFIAFSALVKIKFLKINFKNLLTNKEKCDILYTY